MERTSLLPFKSSLGKLLFEFQSFRCRSRGLSIQQVDHGLKLLLEMKDIAMTRDIRQDFFLTGSQPCPAICNGKIWLKPLFHHIEQMPAPGLSIAVFHPLQQIAVS